MSRKGPEQWACEDTEQLLLVRGSPGNSSGADLRVFLEVAGLLFSSMSLCPLRTPEHVLQAEARGYWALFIDLFYTPQLLFSLPLSHPSTGGMGVHMMRGVLSSAPWGPGL